jgi:hypothetical protein
MDSGVGKQLRRVRTLGRGTYGTVVWLASDEASGELLAVKSATAGSARVVGIDRRLLLGSTVSSCWDRPSALTRPSALAGIDRQL